eukprot:3936513-Rhodomonas_salina.1
MALNRPQSPQRTIPTSLATVAELPSLMDTLSAVFHRLWPLQWSTPNLPTFPCRGTTWMGHSAEWITRGSSLCPSSTLTSA